MKLNQQEIKEILSDLDEISKKCLTLDAALTQTVKEIIPKINNDNFGTGSSKAKAYESLVGSLDVLDSLNTKLIFLTQGLSKISN